MDVQYINPFLEATIHVLRTMAFVTAKPGKPFVKKDEIAKGDISGVIGLSGDHTGSLSISFSFTCIKGILEKMLGDIHDELNEEVNDAVGELTNMICGQARNKLEKIGVNIKAGIPTIIAGTNHTIRHITSSPIIVLPFTTEYGDFFVEFSFLE